MFTSLWRIIGIFAVLCIFATAQTHTLPGPAGPGSGQPYLTTASDGRVLLSWIDRLNDGRFSLRFSTREEKGWSKPSIIAEGSNWFVNWADFPSILALTDGSLAAHWLVKSDVGKFDYDVNISRSFDGGRSWTKPVIPHRDGAKAEHGFVSLFEAKDGALSAVWLDGREMKSEPSAGGHGHGDMTLRYAKIKRDGVPIEETLLDGRVCECCQTSAAMTDEGPVVVYRDRSTDEIRDISLIRIKDGKWTAPRTVAQDGWKLNGCPVNGPAVAARGKRVAVAWFTGADDQARVKLAFSDNAGDTFGAPVIVDEGRPIGRVDVLLLKDGGVIVSWLEKLDGGGAVRVRRIHPNGKLDPSIVVAPAGTARSSGFPQMALAGDALLFAWTADRVMTTSVPLAALMPPNDH
jgi:hypothetical protein